MKTTFEWRVASEDSPAGYETLHKTDTLDEMRHFFCQLFSNPRNGGRVMICVAELIFFGKAAVIACVENGAEFNVKIERIWKRAMEAEHALP